MASSGCIRVQNTFPQTHASVAGSSDSCPGRTAYGAYERGNSVSNFQGCHFSGESLPTTIHFNTLSSGERTRDRGVPPCDQSKGAKQISSEGEVQNGGAPYCSLSSTQGRLYDETRPAGRLLCGPDTPGVEEISSFPVQGNNLRVPLPPIWPLPGPPSLHQNPPSDCRQTAFRGDTNSHLLGRSSPDSPSEGHIERDLPLCEETFVQPGFPSETREMLSRTNSSLGLSGCGVRHNLHVSGSARGTDQSDTGSMPGNARVSVNIPGWTVEPLGRHEPCRTDRPVDSTIILQRPAAPAGSAASPVRMETKVSDVIVSTLPGGPEMVGVPDSARAQQPGHHSSSIRPYHHDRCILTGLGCNLQWHVDGGTLERGGGRTTHQLFRTQGSHSSFEGFPESRHAAITTESGTPSPSSYPSGDGQYNSCRLCEQEGGTQSPFLSLLVLELWSFLLTQGSWVTARHLPGVLNVEADAASRLFNLRTEWMLRRYVFQDIAHHFYLPEINLFASRLNHQLPLYASRLPDSSAAAVDAFQQDWSQWEFHPPTSSATVSNSSESEKRQSNRPTSSPRLARSTMVPSDSTDADRCTIPTTQGEVTADSALRPRGGSPSVAVSQSDCMADIGSAYQAAGFPEEVTNVLLASWSQSTKKRYQGPWRAWSNWCSSRRLCPFSAPVTDVLTFLTETVTNQSLEYRTLAVYKSAISQGHLPVGQTKLGDLPVV